MDGTKRVSQASHKPATFTHLLPEGDMCQGCPDTRVQELLALPEVPAPAFLRGVYVIATEMHCKGRREVADASALSCSRPIPDV